jgi:spore maturation protein CgeB
MPALVAEYQRALVAAAQRLRPHLFFVFKGTNVAPKTIDTIRELGCIAINFYPDVGLASESQLIAAALPKYDWVFSTKSFRLADMRRELGVSNASFLPHSYDPEVHAPVMLNAEDINRYGCDASFIGTWSPKKEAALARVRQALPEVDLKIWGNQWERASSDFGRSLMRQPVNGIEYAKAIQASTISIAMLVEAPKDSRIGDLSTARTFEIPAVGTFMLHERTAEAASYFSETRECAMFADANELAQRIRQYQVQARDREKIASAGHQRCLTSGYSVDDRVNTVLEKLAELRLARAVPSASSWPDS